MVMKMKAVVFCDIDGVICPQYFSSKNFNPDKARNIQLSENIVESIKFITKNSDLIFLTGRPDEWKDTTFKMLKPMSNHYRIYFHNFKGEWNKKKYFQFKLDKINELSKNYDLIVVIDDMLDLLKYIKQKFYINNKILLLMHAIYDKKIKNMRCTKLL